MRTFGRLVFLHCSTTASVPSRTAVYGPVRTVVWQGSAGDCRPYADLTGYPEMRLCDRITSCLSAIRKLRHTNTRSVTVSSLIAKYRPHKLCFKTYGLQWLDRTFAPRETDRSLMCVAASEQCWRHGLDPSH